MKNKTIMPITSERLRQTFSEGGAQEIYQEIKAKGNFLGFARQFVFDSDYRVARSALWGLTKATDGELSELQVILNELIDQAMQAENSSVRRLTLNIIERLRVGERSSGMRLRVGERSSGMRLTLKKDDLRTDFLDFCFEHMVSIEEFPGIQTLCMKLAYRMCTFYPELMDELKRTLEAMEIEYYKPAVKCLRKRILSGKFK